MRDCCWHRQIALVLLADDLRRSDEEQRTARKVYRSRDEAKADVLDYIERFYNRASEHLSGYVVDEKRFC